MQTVTCFPLPPCGTIARCSIFRRSERMEVIHVPRPSKKAMNPERPANALLLSQVSHLQHAERRLPLRYRTKIYTHAIETEGEAAEYIREVTEAIHQAQTLQSGEPDMRVGPLSRSRPRRTK